MTCNCSAVVGIISGLLPSSQRTRIPVQHVGVMPRDIVPIQMLPARSKKSGETNNWDVASKDTTLACAKGDWVV